MNIMFGILGSLIQLAIFVGVIVLIVRLVGKREKATGEGAAVAIRRFFHYMVMLVMLVLAGIGLAGLVDAAAATSASVTQDSTTVARSIALVVVGLPVFSGLAIYTARRLRHDSHEQQSLAWASYLTIALLGSLIAAMSLVIALLGELLDAQEIDRTLLINAVIWAAVWGGHSWVAQRKGLQERMQISVLLGSAVGLVAAVSGAGAGLAAILQEIYDDVFGVSVISGDAGEIVLPLIILGVGIPVWWWHWLHRARRGARTPWWLAYVLLLGILGGVVAVVSGAGVVLFGVLQWIFGDASSVSAATHFDFIPGALGAVAVGGAIWAYHGIVLGDREQRDRTEIDRVYDYLLSGAGLLVAAGGLATLVAVALDAVEGREITSSSSGDVAAVATTLLAVGAPLWWRYWSNIRRERETDPQGELRSVTRRIYLFLLFGITGIVAVVDLIILVFIVFEDLLDGTLGSSTISSAAVPIALLVTAGALAWYHFAVFREDRDAAPDEERSALREVILVCTDGDHLAETINARTGAAVRLLRVVGARTAAGTFEDVLAALGTEQRQRVVVVASGDDRYAVMPIEG